MKQKFIDLYMDLAVRISQESYATRLKVGAIAVKDNKIIGQGYNGTPPGWDNICEDDNNVTKPEVIHAEQNLVCSVARSNESTVGATIFTTTAPCEQCAKLIIASGFKDVYYKDLYRSDIGLKILEQANIKIIKVD
jgi:dCMP deaminase